MWRLCFSSRYHLVTPLLTYWHGVCYRGCIFYQAILKICYFLQWECYVFYGWAVSNKKNRRWPTSSLGFQALGMFKRLPQFEAVNIYLSHWWGDNAALYLKRYLVTELCLILITELVCLLVGNKYSSAVIWNSTNAWCFLAISNSSIGHAGLHFVGNVSASKEARAYQFTLTSYNILNGLWSHSMGKIPQLIKLMPATC